MAVFLVVLITNIILNWSFNGPVYLHDEIGYLTNAIAFAGGSVDGANSYHAGYSLFIAPAFLISKDPAIIWKCIIIINSLISSTTFAVIYRFFLAIAPSIGYQNRIVCIFISALYPPYIASSGYAFSHPLILLFFVISIFLLLKFIETRSNIWVIGHTAACGFIFWVHPTGAVIGLASILTLFVIAWKDSQWTAALGGSALIILLALAYKFVVAPYLTVAMTPPGHLPDLHYPSLASILERLSTLASIADVFVRTLGAAAYIGVATLGFAFWGAAIAGSRVISVVRPLPTKDGYVWLFCLLSLLGTLPVGALTLPPGISSPSDVFFYGRYAESVLLPVLILGIMFRNKDKFLLGALFIFFCTAILVLQPEFLRASSIGRWRGMNFINASGLWAVVFPTQIPIWGMFAIGTLAVVIVGLLSNKSARICLFIIFSIGIFSALQWHKSLYALWGAPGSLPSLIRESWPDKACVGVDPDEQSGADSRFRLRLFRYYLHSFNFRRTSEQEWTALCDGPLLTYRPHQFVNENVEIVAKERISGLYLVARKDLGRISRDYSDLHTQSNMSCLINWCFDASSTEISSQAGVVENGNLTTNGSAGYLAYGPYIKLPPGNYVAKIDIHIKIPGRSYIEAINSKNKTIIAKEMIDRIGIGLQTAELRFNIEEQVDSFELRIYATPDASFSVSRYVISK